MQKNRRFSVITICRIAVIAALFFVLNRFVNIQIVNLKITPASLPIVLSALLFGPLEAAVSALLGELLNQLLSYGLTMTTVAWLIPPVLRALIIGLVAKQYYKRKNKPLERAIIPCYLTCLGGALATTIANTFVIWLDAVVYGYYTFALVFGQTLIRFITSIVTAVIVTTLVIPIADRTRRILRKPAL